MKHVLIAAALCISNFLFAQESATSKKGILSFESEIVDYGTINQNEDGNRSFKFTNTGNAPIVITKIKVSCGCTIATKPNKPIMPNETAEIGVKYATNRVGAFSKTITITSNAVKGSKTLRIKGVVIKPIKIDDVQITKTGL